MDHRIRTALWALAGLAFAVGLSMAAFAVAGGRISEPAGSVRIVPVQDEQRPEPQSSPKVTPSPKRSDEPTPSPQTSAAPTQDPSGSSEPDRPSDDPAGSHDGNDD
jgi:hypothetical protein